MLSTTCSECIRRCDDFCLSRVSIFKNLEGDQKVDVLKKIDHRQYKKGDVIFNEGDNSKTLYFMSSGKIKLYKYTTDGKEQIINVLSDGEFFGEFSILKNTNYRVNARAITDCKICTLTSNEIRDIIAKKPEVSISIMESLAERLSEAESLARSLATNDVEARLAYLLTSLINKYGVDKKDGIEITLPINREDMANYIGVTRETISRKLKKFEHEDIIKIVGNKKIIVLNREFFYDYI
ncbi:CRP/FNR family transcriptional regulator, anaerobic regulatory protein [Clostridium sp. DSM 8431]|uniref:Crp/Fnr family transcriptional regulator n=1 Tax=Clostridium sp. DSM 8431 TaxID=1761781 RepID=UPI0008EDEEE4|nr:Crp/Fnr family transcriptional regulator [Clostridium sp. DSM 8431]SFU43766.1 CRP/FNR family transcriptional regulator, anaerobic regulatory protein [Clostridium sp. DSM 8431]